ncbi:hypothetical protein UlMin_006147 [Ulmus minor]
MEGCKIIAIPLESNKALKKEDGSPKADQTKFRSLIGSLLYLTTTRPYIMYATYLLSRFMQSPSQIHYGEAKRVDWAGLVEDMRSTLGYAFTLQATIAQSLTQAEYIAAALTTS